jgi:hypothetical protein
MVARSHRDDVGKGGQFFKVNLLRAETVCPLLESNRTLAFMRCYIRTTTTGVPHNRDGSRIPLGPLEPSRHGRAGEGAGG